MTLELHPVRSSQISAIGYDPSTMTLEIQFKSGGRYQYADVPPDVYRALRQADSVGSHFHRHIRNAGYAYKRLDQGEPA